MRNRSNKSRYRLAALCLAVFCGACGQQSQAQSNAANTTPDDWPFVCLGRLTINFPVVLEMGAAPTQHHSGYGIEGITGAATDAQRIHGIDIQETAEAT